MADFDITGCRDLGIYGYRTIGDIRDSGDLIRAQISGDCPKRSPVTGNTVPLAEREIDYATGIRRLNFLRISAYAKYGGKEDTPAHVRDAFDEEVRRTQALREKSAPEPFPFNERLKSQSMAMRTMDVDREIGRLRESFSDEFIEKYFSGDVSSMKDVDLDEHLNRLVEENDYRERILDPWEHVIFIDDTGLGDAPYAVGVWEPREFGWDWRTFGNRAEALEFYEIHSGEKDVEMAYGAEDEEDEESVEEAGEEEATKEDKTFFKIAEDEVKEERKKLRKFTKTRLGSNIWRKIEKEALKLKPGKYPGSKRFELKVTAQMLKWTGGTTEWDWEYVGTNDLGPGKHVWVPSKDKTVYKLPGTCELCGHPIRYEWVFRQRDPPTGKIVKTGVVCAHSQMGVPQDLLARAYALVTKLAGIAKRKTKNSELSAEFGEWLEKVLAIDPDGLVTASRGTQKKMFERFEDTGEVKHMLRNVYSWIETDKSTSLRLSKDFLDRMRELKDDPGWLDELASDVKDAEREKARREEERKIRWLSREARTYGLNPDNFDSSDALRRAIEEEKDKRRRERWEKRARELGLNPALYPGVEELRDAIDEEMERRRWFDRAGAVGIDPDDYPTPGGLRQAVEKAERAEDESLKRFLKAYADTNDYLGKLAGLGLDKLTPGQESQLKQIKKYFEEELARHPEEFGYVLAHADDDYEFAGIVRSVSFGNELKERALKRIRQRMTGPGGAGPGVPSKWSKADWEALVWFRDNEDDIRKYYPKNWMFKENTRYGRSFIESVEAFAGQNRPLTANMSRVWLKNVDKLKERLARKRKSGSAGSAKKKNGPGSNAGDGADGSGVSLATIRKKYPYAKSDEQALYFWLGDEQQRAKQIYKKKVSSQINQPPQDEIREIMAECEQIRRNASDTYTRLLKEVRGGSDEVSKKAPGNDFSPRTGLRDHLFCPVCDYEQEDVSFDDWVDGSGYYDDWHFEYSNAGSNFYETCPKYTCERCGTVWRECWGGVAPVGGGEVELLDCSEIEILKRGGSEEAPEGKKADVGDYVRVHGRIGVVTGATAEGAYVQFPTGYEAGYLWYQVHRCRDQAGSEKKFEEARR